MPLTFRWCFMVMKFFVPLELHRNLERVGGVGGDRNGDNGEGDNEDDDDHGSSCPLSRCLPGTVLRLPMHGLQKLPNNIRKWKPFAYAQGG